MLDLGTGRRTILRELDSLIDRLDAASDDDWARPTRCEGWTVLELAVHCTLSPRASAEGFRRLRTNVSEPGPAPEEPKPQREDVMASLRTGRNELTRALASLNPDWMVRDFPLYFVTLPGIFGLQLVALELGMHRNDLDWALGDEVPLPPEVADAGMTLAAGLLPRIAAGAEHQPGSPLAFALSSPGRRLEIVFGDGEWRAGADPSVPTCEIEGSDSSLVLFAYGRIPASHPSLRISGERDQAERFKSYFPGPYLPEPERVTSDD